VQKWLVGATPSIHLKFWINRPRWSEIADFLSLFARNDSAVKPSEKSSINTNRKSTTRFPMSPRKTPVSEPSVRSQNSESVGVGRAQTTASGVSYELANHRRGTKGFRRAATWRPRPIRMLIGFTVCTFFILFVDFLLWFRLAH